MTNNLFHNGSFEAGTHNPGGISELNIPDRWSFQFALHTIPNPHDPADHARFVRPEVRVLSRADLPENEHDLFILDFNHTLKIFKRSGSWWASLYQVCEIQPGDYTARIRLFGDLVKAYRGDTKVWADDPAGRDGLFRFMINAEHTDWQIIRPGDWNTYTHAFTAQGTTTIGADIMCPFPLYNNGIFADHWELNLIPPPPIPTEAQAVAVFRKAWREMFPPK
jgi:hypothetical protein